jgi:Mn-containing catalase
VRGPWNEAPDFDYVANPEPRGGMPGPPINPDDEGHKPDDPVKRKPVHGYKA